MLAYVAHWLIGHTRQVWLEQHDPSRAGAPVRLPLRPCYYRGAKNGVEDMPTRSKPDHDRSIAVLLATLGCAVAIAACGSSGNSSGSGRRNAGIAVAQCMRAHGITNFPDPGSGGGIQIPAGSGINPQSPGFQSAQKACFKLLPGGGPGGGKPASESQKRQMLAMSVCMRRHGLSTFPDPVSTPPRLSNGLGLAFGRPGSFIVIPLALMNSPAFHQAAAACGLPGAGKRPGHATP